MDSKAVFQAVDILKARVHEYQALIELAAVLEELGSLEDAISAKKKMLVELREQYGVAVAEYKTAVANTDNARKEAAAILETARHEAAQFKEEAGAMVASWKTQAEADIRAVTEAERENRKQIADDIEKLTSERNTLTHDVADFTAKLDELKGKLQNIHQQAFA